MKKLLLSLALLGFMGSASAEIQYPYTFSQLFTTDDWDLPEGWITYGNTAQPVSTFSQFFPDYQTGPWYSILGEGDTWTGAMSCSQFANGSKSSQWLVTPEIEIGTSPVMVSYEVLAFMSRGDNNFKVYVAEQPQSKEDFLKSSPKADTYLTTSSDFELTTKRLQLYNLAGKKVRFAFVNEGNNKGLLGFNNILVGPYYISFEDEKGLENYRLDSGLPYFGMTVHISTPEACMGFTAELETEDGQKSTYKTSERISYGLISDITFRFPDVIVMGDKSTMKYTLSIKPNNSSYPATVITGNLSSSRRLYDSVVVMEDRTGTWCPNCPTGIAWMEYYHNAYTWENGKKVIGIAVHENSSGTDPMQVDEYAAAMKLQGQKAGSNGYPSIVCNRVAASYPGQLDIEPYFASKSYAQTRISKVEYDGTPGGKVSVQFNSRVGMDSEDAGLNASVVVIENDVNVPGNAQYNQRNTYAGLSDANVSSRYGAQIVPYMKLFTNTASAGAVMASKMFYQEVARGAFPAYQGMALAGNWTNDEFRTDEITFTMPRNVLKPENTEMIVLLIKRDTGEIVAADILPAEKYNDSVGVAEAGTDFADVKAVFGGVEVYAPSASEVFVYSTDGRLLNSANVAAGTSVVSAGNYSGMAIVRIVSAGKVASCKVML